MTYASSRLLTDPSFELDSGGDVEEQTEGIGKKLMKVFKFKKSSSKSLKNDSSSEDERENNRDRERERHSNKRSGGSRLSKVESNQRKKRGKNRNHMMWSSLLSISSSTPACTWCVPRFDPEKLPLGGSVL